MKQLFLCLIISVILFQCSGKKGDTNATEEFVELTPEQIQEWLDQNLDSVMVRKDFLSSNGLKLPYRLFISPSYNGNEEIPLLVHLHGRGDRGTDNRPEVYNKLPLFNGTNSIASPNMQNKYPSIVLVPQCSDKTINEEWAKWVGNTPETPFEGLGKDGSYTMTDNPSESGFAVLELIESILKNYKIDKGRVYITGISMGGFGTWEYVGRRPDLFAAAVPMAGFSDTSIIEKVKHIPFWIFHGGADKSNPVEGSRTMYKLLKEAGANVQYTEYPDVEHSPAFRMAWKEPELLPWIFSKKNDQLK
ncbi:MAG: prolyl oligopeptidase family serine peptidase [Bacteroidetes bacterium]|nr:prolyl oligopeptidase family serine peptidase [Bacteroidota bacterium]MDA1120586.1 prolyl oligopeptidase family serine peptidase [Bacteroidota bacterium]